MKTKHFFREIKVQLPVDSTVEGKTTSFEGNFNFILVTTFLAILAKARSFWNISVAFVDFSNLFLTSFSIFWYKSPRAFDFDSGIEKKGKKTAELLI